jgi:RNA polymerase sigma factor (TIGR02999 family)
VAESGQGEITQLLARWEQGESGAVEALAPLVYDQLRAIAEGYLRNERPEHTLQPTAVVNEVFVDLLRMRRLALKDRAHFFTFAAQLTRRVLIDSARKAKSEKRGWAGSARRWTPNWPGWAARAPSRWIFRKRSTIWPNSIRSRPAWSSCTTFSAARG